ncbi:MAG: prephenate dehydrogenase [Kouleothrix sp.]|jgi:prephenate dehydrogenase|nr:prephenate dehydrogenase [Kouleothrix sp.]
MIRITIIGMGLIGTSLALGIRAADPKEAPLGPTVITGYDKNRRAVGDARGRLAIDREAKTLEDALHEAQLVVLAVPVQSIRELLREIAPLLPNGAVVTDVASTKAEVLGWARELLPTTVEFVGGHPMAGKEQAGAAAADPAIFSGAIYCITPGPRARQAAIDLVEAMVRQVKAKVYYIDPAEHDAYVAGISHLPFILSSALVALVGRSPGWKEMAPLAATGFRDISRLASGDAEMHRDIALTNQAALVRWLNEAAQLLIDLRDQIEDGASDELLAFFEEARRIREQWLVDRPNLRPGEDDFEDMSRVGVTRPTLFGRFGAKQPPKQR